MSSTKRRDVQFGQFSLALHAEHKLVSCASAWAKINCLTNLIFRVNELEKTWDEETSAPISGRFDYSRQFVRLQTHYQINKFGAKKRLRVCVMCVMVELTLWHCGIKNERMRSVRKLCSPMIAKVLRRISFDTSQPSIRLSRLDCTWNETILNAFAQLTSDVKIVAWHRRDYAMCCSQSFLTASTIHWKNCVNQWSTGDDILWPCILQNILHLGDGDRQPNGRQTQLMSTLDTDLSSIASFLTENTFFFFFVFDLCRRKNRNTFTLCLHSNCITPLGSSARLSRVHTHTQPNGKFVFNELPRINYPNLVALHAATNVFLFRLQWTNKRNEQKTRPTPKAQMTLFFFIVCSAQFFSFFCNLRTMFIVLLSFVR